MNASEDEFDAEFVDEEDAEVTPASVKRLREKLKKAVEEKQEYLDGWQRARADFANYKKEEASMHSDKEDRIRSNVIEALLPALDTFEMAIKHAKGDSNKELEIVYKQLLQSLRSLGVEQYGKAGEKFDPYKYEALREITTDEKDHDHTVESVERSGYSIGEKIIRPAQVSVYSYKE